VKRKPKRKYQHQAAQKAFLASVPHQDPRVLESICHALLKAEVRTDDVAEKLRSIYHRAPRHFPGVVNYLYRATQRAQTLRLKRDQTKAICTGVSMVNTLERFYHDIVPREQKQLDELFSCETDPNRIEQGIEGIRFARFDGNETVSGRTEYRKIHPPAGVRGIYFRSRCGL
jgi:hypothetical protein